MKKIVVITGPTAVGKTAISIKLAKHFNGEIINADASIFHRDLNIGTAKIKKEEMDGVKHHLIDFISPTEEFSIKDFQIMARKAIANIKTPFIVGGSGLYINALITDYDLSSPKRNKEIYEGISNEELYQELLKLDPKTAQKVHVNNRRRVERYLELIKNGTTETKEPKLLYDALIICLDKDRDKLYAQINLRCEQMFTSGWIEEVIELEKKGIPVEKIKEIGYSDIDKYLRNEISLEEVKEEIKKKTRHYAKRQLTWFKNKMNCTFYNIDEMGEEKLFSLISDFINDKNNY